MRYYFRALGKYFSISGRASRKEVWMFLLFDILFLLGFMCADILLDTTFTVDNGPNGTMLLGNKSVLYIAFTFIPTLTLYVRRLHDVNRSGFWWLVTYIPIICIYPYCLIFFAESNRGPNKYGDVPENVRGYQPTVYVNVNMNQTDDGRYEEYAYGNQDDSPPNKGYRVHVNKRRSEPQSQDNCVYEENTYTDFEEVPSESSEYYEPPAETSEATSSSHSPLAIAVGIAITLGLILFIIYFVNNSLKPNVESPKEKVEFLSSQNTEAQIAGFLSDGNAGYASDGFHADTPLLRISISDEEATFGVVRIYDTSYHLEVSGDSIETEWYDYYTRVCVYPKKKGISYITFSNELNDETFQVMVVVE